MLTHRPCGACGAMVPADRGCKHWPVAKMTVGRGSKLSGATRRKLAAERAAANEAKKQELYRQMGVTP